MTEPIVDVRNVSKRYKHTHYRPSLRYEAHDFLKQWLFPHPPVSEDDNAIWALKEVSFSIQPGEALGVVGRNGAGKTTLLKLLSGITKPTTGQVFVGGRFVSLVGLGAGFDPQRSGRENIYLNAAIFGVSPTQTHQIVDEIIAFSELHDFIDRPVKVYSSGMSARLGFSIAVHIFPDIIFLDEVLAVGDAGFVHKCNQRILALRNQSKTFILVSHNLADIELLCNRCIWLHEGAVVMNGDTPSVLEAYQRQFA